jgi:demethylmenaquinone methyltransferase/2-methoxy-6-polyprenyl-1,4-benzoquinol methylase
MINTDTVKRKYRRNAYYYDFVTQAFSRIRFRAIAQLKLKPGDTVLDFGCGTGLSFALIEQPIGPAGQIVGVELSPHMLDKAQEKISRYKWANITLLEANAEEVNLPPESVDAVLSFYTHDIMSSRQSVARAVQALRRGGIFVAAGSKLVGGARGRLLDPITLAYARTAITLPLTIRPWSYLEERLGPLKVQEYLLGSSYIAWGKKAPPEE